jgi:hypothetical protein
MTTQIFGDFIEEYKGDGDYLKLGFSPSSIPLQRRWRTNGLSADFIADYLEVFFIGQPATNSDPTIPIPVRSKNAVKYIANELLENAMKFSDETSHYSTRIAFHLYSDKLVFHVTNSITPQNMKRLKAFIKEVTQGDPSELYFRCMEANANDDNNGHSGLGLLSMINDYSAQLAWKFDTLQIDHEPPTPVVTTMVCLKI